MKRNEFIEEQLEKHGYKGPLEGFEQCKNCKGLCCKASACIAHPVDFGENLTKEVIEKAIDSKKYMITFSISWNSRLITTWEDPKLKLNVTPIISAREVDCPENGIFVSMVHGPCAMLTEHGCLLTAEERPLTGLLHIPNGTSSCETYVEAPFEAWEKYSDLLDEIVKERNGNGIEEAFYNIIEEEAAILKLKVQKYYLSMEERISPWKKEKLGLCKNITAAELRAAEQLSRLGYYHRYDDCRLADILILQIRKVEKDMSA